MDQVQSLENIPCQEHTGSRLCLISTAEKGERKLMCPRCLLKQRPSYDSLTMIDDFVDQNDVTKNLSLGLNNLDTVERTTSDAWTQQTRNIETEIDRIVDEFCDMMEALKIKAREDLEARLQSLKQRKEELNQACQTFNESVQMPDKGTVRDQKTLQSYILALDGAVNPTKQAEKEAILQEAKELGGLRDNVQLDKGLKEFSHQVTQTLTTIRTLYDNHHPPIVRHENKIGDKIKKAAEEASNVGSKFVFADSLNPQGHTLSADKRKATCGNSNWWVGIDVDLAVVKAPVTWKVKTTINGGYLWVGVAKRTAVLKRENSKGKCWAVNSNGYFYYENDGSYSKHGLNMGNGSVVEVVYNQLSNHLQFNCDGKSYASVVMSKPDLVPAIYLTPGDSVELVE